MVRTHRVPLVAVLSLFPIKVAQAEAPTEALFRFGAIADCQYDDRSSDRRKYDLSPDKLRACIEDFNGQDLTHIVHLGDFIDRDWDSYDVVLPIAAMSRAPFRHVLGNHDFEVAESFKPQVPARLGLSSRYYDFTVGTWRFLVLDTNDLSLYAHPQDSPAHARSLAYHRRFASDQPTYNGGIGPEQLAWIEAKLQAADEAGESVVLHSHHPVYPIEAHAAWNALEIVALLERHPSVVAYINGHRHDGAYAFKGGIHYLTLKGMVDTTETAYATISVFADRLEVRGGGRQDDYWLQIPARSTTAR